MRQTDSMDERLLALHGRYTAYLAELATPLGNISLDVDLLFGKERLFGEYYAFWLGEILGLNDDDILQEAAFGSLLGRAFVVVQDRVLDALGRADPHLVVLGGVFLSDFLDIFGSLLRGQPQFRERMRKWIHESAAANLREQREHREKLSPFSTRDFLGLGLKSGLIHIPVEALGLLASRKDAIEPLSQAMDLALLSIQICDDIADWRQDLSRQNFTYPLTVALQMIYGTDVRQQSVAENIEAVPRALFFSGLAERLLNVSMACAILARNTVLGIAGQDTLLSNYLAGVNLRRQRIRDALIEVKVGSLGDEFGQVPTEQPCSIPTVNDLLAIIPTWEAMWKAAPSRAWELIRTGKHSAVLAELQAVAEQLVPAPVAPDELAP